MSFRDPQDVEMEPVKSDFADDATDNLAIRSRVNEPQRLEAVFTYDGDIKRPQTLANFHRFFPRCNPDWFFVHVNCRIKCPGGDSFYRP
jgi:hypothetical protein